LEGKAGFAQPAGAPLDGILGNAGYSTGRPDAHSVNQTSDHGTTLFM
jgi:hypothetical protein